MVHEKKGILRTNKRTKYKERKKERKKERTFNADGTGHLV
jgi:hypothetical protein